MASLPQQVPVLMVGGSLDLVTPPLEEQLRLFLPAGNPASRLVLLEGGSHFSPLRLADQGEAVLRLGRDLVGVDPARAQKLLLALSLDFLQLAREPLALPAQLRSQEGIRAYVLDGAAASRWQALSRP
jgi:predicted dienelactone hydrolase